MYCLNAKGDAEIDLLIDYRRRPRLLREMKSKIIVSEGDAKTLEPLGADLHKNAERWLFSNDPISQRLGKTSAMLWPEGRLKLFGS